MDNSKVRSKKWKGEQGRACSTPLHTTDHHGKDSDNEEDAADDGKTAATKGNKRQTLNREGIG